MTKNGKRRRVLTWNRFSKFDAQRPLKHIPESKKVCSSEMKHKKKGTGPLLGLEKTQNHCVSILFPSSPSGDFSLEREHVGWEQPRALMGDIGRDCSALHPRVASLRPHENTCQRFKRLTDHRTTTGHFQVVVVTGTEGQISFFFKRKGKLVRLITSQMLYITLQKNSRFPFHLTSYNHWENNSAITWNQTKCKKITTCWFLFFSFLIGATTLVGMNIIF